MYCEKCGNQVEKGTLFCEWCGTKVVEDERNVSSEIPSPPNNPTMVQKMKEMLQRTEPDKNMNVAVMMFIIVVTVLIVCLVFVKYSVDSKYVNMVKGGHPFAHPNKSYEEAFDSFFDSPKWKYFKSEDGLDIVQFDGECTYNELPAHMTMQFVVDEKALIFDAYAMEIDGVSQNNFFIKSAIDRIFEG